MSKSWDITEVDYVVKNELEYNLKDNVYLYENKLYSIFLVKDVRKENSFFCTDYYVHFMSLDGSEKLKSKIRVDDEFLSACKDLDDIANEILKKLQEKGLVYVSDELVNTEAFRTLYL